MPLSVLSLNAGIGSHLKEYEKLGAKVRLACEYQNELYSVLSATNKKVLQIDPVWYINRKEKGTKILLEDAGLRRPGELDVLEVSMGFNGTEKNLFDGFKIARTLKPKLIIAWGPSDLLSNENYHRFNRSLDFLRYDNLNDPEQREYEVTGLVLNASHYGAAVDKSLTLVIGLRTDISERKAIFHDLALRSVVPKPSKPKTLESAIKKIALLPEQKDFLVEETINTKGLMELAKLLPGDSDQVISYSRAENSGPRLAREKGISKSLINVVLRSSHSEPLPDPSSNIVLHPTENRVVGLEEICACWGIKTNRPKTLTERKFRRYVCESVPPIVAKTIFESLTSNLLKSRKQYNEWDEHVLKTNLVEGLRSEGEVRTYYCETDIGFEASREVIGRLPKDKDYDYIFDSNAIREDFIVLGPLNPIEGRRDVIGAIRKDAFKGKNRENAIETIKSVRGYTDNRRNEVPTDITQATITKWEDQGWEVRLSGDRKSYVKRKPGGAWGTFWKTEKIPSANLGWSRDKQTGLPAKSAELEKSNLEEGFRKLNSTATSAYRYLSFDDFVKQARFVRKRINKANTLSAVFTTMAVNRYGSEMRGMGYHIDQGDDDSGLTTISVFDEGHYEGGLFVLPRYRVAFRVGDGDVLVANSRQVHGVSALEGDGRRLSVVSYTKTSLAAKENLKRAYPPKSPRPKFRVDTYQIAVPSYKRYETLAKKTLRTLERYKVDPARVTVFVANEDEFTQYQKSLSNCPYRRLVIAEKGIRQVRNFMWKYYPEGTPVVFLDDDITRIQRLVKPKGENSKLVEVVDLYKEVFVPGFSTCREYNSYLWGIYASTNTLFMDASTSQEMESEEINPDEIVIGNQFINGQLFGAIVRHKASLKIEGNAKVDHELSLSHFVEDGRVVKLKFIAVEADFAQESGGLQGIRTVDTFNEAATYLKKKYPSLVRVEEHIKTIKYGDRKGERATFYELRHI